MFSSFYTHLVLFIACISFLLSFLFFLIRLENHYNSFQLQQTRLINNNNQSQTSHLSTENIIKDNRNFIDQQINEISLREKILGTNIKNDSIFNRLTFINPLKTSCTNLNDSNKSIIIIVLSRALNIDYRQAIRATWGHNGKYKSSSITVQTIFFIGIDDSTQLAMQNEQDIFNDIVQINVPENHAFLVYKELAALFWLRLYCPLTRFLFRIDDDMILDVFLLLNRIEHQIDLEHKDGIYGWFRFNNSVLRFGRGAITKREYESDTYPPYTYSVGYLFSNDSCQRLIDAIKFSKQQLIRTSDVYITGILRNLAQIPYYTYSALEYTTTYLNQMSCETHFERRPYLLVCTSKLHIGVRGDPHEYYDVWDGILLKYNKSLSTV